MALYLLKPLVWNSNGYLRPSGAKVHSGYPKDHGYGHEEWNNSKKLEFVDDGTRWKAFHTEGFGNQPLEVHNGNIMVFMIAAHESRQFLVAVAGNARSLIGDQHKNRRTSIAQKLGIAKEFRDDAWSVAKVRRLFENNQARFNRHWQSEVHWIPNWLSPADCYISLAEPLPLDAKSISGKSSLIRMFGSYQEISRQTALKILDLIPNAQAEAQSLKERCTDESDLPEDLEKLENVASTTQAALIEARIGQGRYRADLLGFWGGLCAVTGCGVGEIIRASHLKPWRDSTNKERLDPRNGLPLVAHLDALFDRGLISFDQKGRMVISKALSDADRKTLHLSDGLRSVPHERTAQYLTWHREHVFRPG